MYKEVWQQIVEKGKPKPPPRPNLVPLVTSPGFKTAHKLAHREMSSQSAWFTRSSFIVRVIRLRDNDTTEEDEKNYIATKTAECRNSLLVGVPFYAEHCLCRVTGLHNSSPPDLNIIAYN